MILRFGVLASVFACSLLSNSVLAASPKDLDPDTPVSQILSLAAGSLSSGSSQDALAYYDIAISKDPKNYLSVFKRGATYLSLGRTAQALSDFDRVLTIKPGFEGALTQRAKIKARNADWKGAAADYAAAGKKADGEEIQGLQAAEGQVTLAKDARKAKNWEACVQHAGAAIMVAGASLELRKLRSRCRLEKGEVVEAVGDLQHVLQINPSATEPHLQISAMTFYSMGETDKGVAAIKRCLQSDPDSKPCSAMFKKEKSIVKALKKIQQLIDKRSYSGATKLLVTHAEEEGLIDTIKEDIKSFRHDNIIHPNAPSDLLTNALELTCSSYLEMNNHKRAAPFCNELLAHNGNALSGLLHKAQSLIDADDFEGAIRVLNSARESHGQQHGKLNAMLENAQTLFKRSKTKDYYKVLELSRDASPKEIKRAYLRLSKQNHPDKASSQDARPAAEKKMAQINEAYEVLSDPELKARFDQGDDPNDPEAQARGHGGGFPGGHPFAGGQGGQQFFFRSSGGGGQRQQGGGMPNFGGGGGGGGGFQFPGGFPFP